MRTYRKLFASGTMVFALAGIITSVTTAATAHPSHRGRVPAIDREVPRRQHAALRRGTRPLHIGRPTQQA